MPQATRAGSGFQGPPLPIQPSGGCTPNGSASNRIGQQQQPVDQTDGVPYREQICKLWQNLLCCKGHDHDALGIPACTFVSFKVVSLFF